MRVEINKFLPASILETPLFFPFKQLLTRAESKLKEFLHNKIILLISLERNSLKSSVNLSDFKSFIFLKSVNVLLKFWKN